MYSRKKSRDDIIVEKLSKIHNAINGLTYACNILESHAIHELASTIDNAKASLITIQSDIKTLDNTDDNYHELIDKLDTTYALCINVRFPYENTKKLH
jgi:hypothetical protein